jgi:hypothetical protein
VSGGVLRLTGDWLVHRDASKPRGPLIAAYHPAARVGHESMQRLWDALATALRWRDCSLVESNVAGKGYSPADVVACDPPERSTPVASNRGP